MPASFVQEQYESETYYTMRFADLAAIDSQWGMRWRYILQVLRQAGGAGRLLDIGAGNGYFVRLASSAGFGATGLEISQKEIDFAREVVGVHLENSDLATMTEAYDVLTLFNVIEHVPDPATLLAQAWSRCRENGLIALTTPNPGCLRARVVGVERWEMICPPHHLNILGAKGLAPLLNRTGFRLVRYETLSTYMSWLGKAGRAGRVLKPGMFHALRRLRLGADHFVVARKVER